MSVSTIAALTVFLMAAGAAAQSAPNAESVPKAERLAEAVVDPEFAALREEAMRVVAPLAEGKLDFEQWFRHAQDHPERVRRQVLNEVAADGRLADRAQQVYLRFLREDPSPKLHTAAASMLRPRDRDSIAALVAASEGKDPWLRVFACQSMGYAKAAPGLDMDAIHGALLRRLKDDDVQVAGTATVALGNLGHQPAVPQIIALFRAHPEDPGVAWHCAEALARLGEREVVFDAAHVALTSDNWNGCFFAIRHLDEVDSPRVVPFLVSHLAGEVERSLIDLKQHRVEPRVLKTMIEQLQSRTGNHLGARASRWVAWYTEHAERYPKPRWEVRKVDPEAERLVLDLWDRLPRVEGVEWQHAVATILAQKDNDAIRYADLNGAIGVLGRSAAVLPPKREQERQSCVGVLDGLLARRRHWRVTAAHPTGVGPPDELLERAIRGILKRFGASNAD